MIIIATEKQQLLASSLLRNFSKAKIKTDFFTIHHFRDYLDSSRRNYIEEMLDKKIESNTDLLPYGFLNFLLLQQTKFYPSLKFNIANTRGIITSILPVIILIVLALTIIFKRTSALINMGIIGFISISFSAMIFVLFQLYSGALFWKLGLLVGIFMVGLSLGALLINSILIRKGTHHLEMSILYLGWAILTLSLILAITKLGISAYADLLFYFLSLIAGALTGAAYPLVTDTLLKNKFDPKNITVFTYSSDLTGAFLGTLTCSILLIPFLGIYQSLIILLGIAVVFSLKSLLA